MMADTIEMPLAFRRVYRIPDRTWRMSDYQGSLANGGLDGVDAGRSGLMADMYSQVRSQQNNNEEELRLGTELGALQFRQPLTGADRTRLLATLVRLDLVNTSIVVIARQQIESFRGLKYANSTDELAQARKEQFWPKQVAEMRIKYGSCVNPNAIAAFDKRLL